MQNLQSEPFVIERTYNASLKTVWSAITDKDKMKEWYFNFKEFKPEVGFEFHFFGGPEDRQYKHVCKITEVIPEKKLTYSWSYEGYSGISYVSFELFAEGDKTRLKLTHSGLESFEANQNPDLNKKNFEGGWSYIVGTSLKNYLEGIQNQ